MGGNILILLLFFSFFLLTVDKIMYIFNLEDDGDATSFVQTPFKNHRRRSTIGLNLTSIQTTAAS